MLIFFRDDLTGLEKGRSLPGTDSFSWLLVMLKVEMEVMGFAQVCLSHVTGVLGMA